VSEARPIPYGRQSIDEDDIAAVVRVLRSDYLTTGPELEAFERELAQASGVRHAIAVANGTAALHCAYAAIGIGPGDEVVTTPLTFSATSNMLLALGARPVFADIDPRTLCLDVAAVEAAITPRTKAIAAVDFAGVPAVTGALRELARARKLLIVDDAAHALGSRLHDRPVGALADVTTLSFHPVKTITTAEGGAVVTDDDAIAQRAKDFRSHGVVRERERLTRWDGAWYYEVSSLGFNYRLSAIQAALGRSQLRKLGAFMARRQEIVDRYRAAFADDTRLELQAPTEGAVPCWHLFTIRVRDKATRARTFAALADDGILAQVHYVAVNDLPLYRELGFRPEQTPIAARASDTIISLPLYPAMLDDDVERVIAATRRALST
jgi:UDP-4-amino-4,6-dideoxy-N-acetyl-beta-L-altrosamine transaminase